MSTNQYGLPSLERSCHKPCPDSAMLSEKARHVLVMRFYLRCALIQVFCTGRKPALISEYELINHMRLTTSEYSS